MRLLVQTAMVFFGTLMVAGVFALGAPSIAELVMSNEAVPVGAASSQLLASTQPHSEKQTTATRPSR